MPLPVVPPFDIYFVGPGIPISQLLLHAEVTTFGAPLQFPIDVTLDQIVQSGGAVVETEAEVAISTSVPEDATFEFTASFKNLPNDFADLVHHHIYYGVSDAAGPCAALLFSKIGIIYTGCAHLGIADVAFDTLLQPLPDSQLLVSENEYWTVRIAMSRATGTVYLYITKAADVPAIGHQLRYVLPVIPSASAAVAPPDRTLILVRGTVAQPSVLALNSIGLGTGLIIPNLRPIADPGVDRALQICEVLQLDGTKSFDPEGGELLYRWRLADAPPSSQYIFLGGDGITYPLPVPTGFTNKFYSAELASVDATDPVVVGDVLVIAGTPHTIQSKGTDGNGFYTVIESAVLPDNLTGTVFSFLRQRGLNTSTSAKPTFYPDAPGLFKFDLTVFDGDLYSAAEAMVVSVAESPVARGCTPDLSFIWGYLSDFWRLVEDKERIDIFWQGLAQVAAAELLNLWQIDYSKSLRDIQRTFQRRWLHYDLLMQQSTTLLEVTTVRAVYGGVESTDIPTAGLSGVNGTQLTIQFSIRTAPVTISFAQTDPYLAATLAAVIQAACAQVDTSIRVYVLNNTAGTAARVRIDAPFPFSLVSPTTVPVFTVGQANAAPTGTAGLPIGTQSYRVERSLRYLDIKQNDFLCIDGTAYRINSVADDLSDPLAFQRLVLLDPILATAGAVWSIAGTATSQDLDFWQGLVEWGDLVTFEVLQLADQQLLDVTARVLGSSEVLSKSLPCDATAVGAYLAQPDLYTVYLKSVKRRRYTPVDPLIVDVPFLQERIVEKDETQVLRRNVDYFHDTFRGLPCLRFITPVPITAGGPDVWQGVEPPDRMWAETSYLDNRERIEANFGIPAEFTLDDLSQLPSTVDYLSSVRGLWYAYFNGPTLFNLRAGTQILLGLPFAEELGLITEIREEFSATHGRILIQDVANAAITRAYTYPTVLSLETNPKTSLPYAVGDTAQQFAPLVTGVEVLDYVKDPTWFGGYLNQGAFFEVEKFFKFLVRVDEVAFNLSALLFVQTFIKRIKPTYTFPMFVVRVDTAAAEVSVSDATTFTGRLILFEGSGFKPPLMGATTMFDDPRAAGGGWRSKYDAADNPAVLPLFPTSDVPVSWAYDKNYLAPEDAILGSTAQIFGAPFLPIIDMPFLRVGEPAWDEPALAFLVGAQGYVAATPGLALGPPQLAPVTSIWNTVIFDARVNTVATPDTFNIVVKVNGFTTEVLPVTLPAGWTRLVIPIAATAPTIGDTIEVLLVSTTGLAVSTSLDKAMVTIGHGVPWVVGVNLPAGTYRSYRQF